MPRLAGVETALQMRVYGNPVRVEDAKSLGIIDRIAEEDLLACAIQFAKEVRAVSIRRTREVADKLGTRDSNAALFAAFREKVSRAQRNLLAPAAGVDAIQAAPGNERSSSGCSFPVRPEP